MSKFIQTSEKDNILYTKLIYLLTEIKLVHGGNGLASTLRRHPKIKDYLSSKQRFILEDLETRYFSPSGDLDVESLES